MDFMGWASHARRNPAILYTLADVIGDNANARTGLCATWE